MCASVQRDGCLLFGCSFKSQLEYGIATAICVPRMRSFLFESSSTKPVSCPCTPRVPFAWPRRDVSHQVFAYRMRSSPELKKIRLALPLWFAINFVQALTHFRGAPLWIEFVTLFTTHFIFFIFFYVIENMISVGHSLGASKLTVLYDTCRLRWRFLSLAVFDTFSCTAASLGANIECVVISRYVQNHRHRSLTRCLFSLFTCQPIFSCTAAFFSASIQYVVISR